MNFVHLHASRDEGGKGCRTVCGLPCGARDTTAYRGLDPHRVTCSACKATAPAPDNCPSCVSGTP